LKFFFDQGISWATGVRACKICVASVTMGAYCSKDGMAKKLWIPSCTWQQMGSQPKHPSRAEHEVCSGKRRRAKIKMAEKL